MTVVAALTLAAGLLSAAATIFIRQGLRRSETYSRRINLITGTAALWAAVLVRA